jgi:hypothetical protein
MPLKLDEEHALSTGLANASDNELHLSDGTTIFPEELGPKNGTAFEAFELPDL